jgi:hypothetical protein
MNQASTNDKKQPTKQSPRTDEPVAAEAQRKPTDSAGSNLAPQIVVTPL